MEDDAEEWSAVRRWRRPLGWLAVTAALWVCGGLPFAVLGVLLAGWHVWRPPAPSLLITLAVVLLGLVPVIWVVGNASRLGHVTPDLVLDNQAPGWVVEAALALLAVGVHRDVRESEVPEGETREGDASEAAVAPTNGLMQ